jgi:hypothetical protein
MEKHITSVSTKDGLRPPVKPAVSISGVIMKALFYLISSIIIVASNYTFAEEAPSNIYKPKYEILKYKMFREFPDKAKLEQEWKAMPFDSLTLERHGCFGECPIFSVTFYRGGKAS